MSDVTIDDGPDPSAAERKGRGFYEKRRTSDKRGRVERISRRALACVCAYPSHPTFSRVGQDKGGSPCEEDKAPGLRGILVYCHIA